MSATDKYTRLRSLAQALADTGPRPTWAAVATKVNALIAETKRLAPKSVRNQWPAAEKLLHELVQDINSTGGVELTSLGGYAPVASPDWTDIGETYGNACDVLGKKRKVRKSKQSNHP